MPTYQQTETFIRDFRRLSREEREAFLKALARFVFDIASMEAGEKDTFRPGLRVKGVHGRLNLFEMSWAHDGRATFMWGNPVYEGKRHVIWIRCGDHNILP